MDAGASTETVSYNQRDLLIYALGIGAPELKFIHEEAEDFSAFPTYPLALAFKGDSADVVPFPPASLGSLLGSLDGVTVAVDAECSIESLAPLPTRGGSFALRTEVCGIEPKASGALVYSESELISSSGESLARIRSAVFAVGVRAATRQGVSFSERVPTPTRKADAEVSETITEQQAHIYRLSGDYNPLHVCPEVAKMSGFERPILHGRCEGGCLHGREHNESGARGVHNES